jgi:urease accessory protein
MNRPLGDPARTGRQLDLVFRTGPDGATFLSRQVAGFPFHITRPFMLDRAPAGMATLILQSVGAGILQGDRIDLAVEAEAGAAVHLTTQASTIVHSMTTDHATQVARVTVRQRAFMEYLPDPLILFPACRLKTRLELVIEPEATLVWCDGYIMHDPKGGDGCFAELAAETELLRGGRTLALDRFAIDGAAMAGGRSATAGYAIHASFGVVADVDLQVLLGELRRAVAPVADTYAGLSLLPHEAGLWCRLLARDGVAWRRGLETLWSTTRRHMTGIEPRPRRK